MQELETMEKSDMKEQEEEYKIPPFGLINMSRFRKKFEPGERKKFGRCRLF